MDKHGHQKKKKMADLSLFFLCEAADDSEGDFDHQNMVTMRTGGLMASHGYMHEGDYADDEEDAQSCSSSTSHGVWGTYRSHVNRGSSSNHIKNGGNHGHNDVDVDNYDNDDDDKDVDCNTKLRKKVHFAGEISEVMSTANSHSSRNSCFDHSSSDRKELSEKERSKLFWEACLAS